MVATPEKVQHTHEQSSRQDRVAVLLMGYGEVESYEDFANYNEQALNLLTAKFAPVPTWIYPPLAKLLALFDRHEWGHTHHDFISPHNAIFEQQRAGLEKLHITPSLNSNALDLKSCYNKGGVMVSKSSKLSTSAHLSYPNKS